MFITTTAGPSTALIRRAECIAERTASSFVQRHGALPALLAEHDAAFAYIVRRDRDEIRSSTDGLFVHPGMLDLKRATGPDHPFLRALQLRGPCSTIVDATLGLARDALHAADALGARVFGIESSVLVYSLLEEGLPRLATVAGPCGRAAARITVEHGDAYAVLAAMPAHSVDVVLLDPMFDAPRPAAPGFDLFRTVAHASTDGAALLEAARRVAASHVVLKVPKRSVCPPCDACVNGKAVRYLVYDATSIPRR